MIYPAVLDKISTTLTFRDFATGPIKAIPGEDPTISARIVLLNALQVLISERVRVPQPSEPQENDVLVTLPASAALTVLLSNTMLEKGIVAAELARLMNVSRPEVTRMTNLRHQTKVDRVQDALAAMGAELEIAARNIRGITVYKTKKGIPTFRRYELQNDGSTAYNMKVGEVRPYSDEVLMLVRNPVSGTQELMLVGHGRMRTASECC
ncbi:hypothetical protein [Burkholderia gladioli]|uniref:hypothetical protein n=1 Tax=Burkholderia gladioli TaxID=28095 RepID=UPI00164028A9|nr:hypothetical protein [Burkholderia gladioli]